jgi:protein-S-isoprenylcysteine O-methyltransferase Ste14
MLYQTLERQGSFLFRWRSFLPFLLLLPLLAEVLIKAFDVHLNMPWWIVLCLMISLAGQAVRIITVGHAPKNTSGRNTKQQKADSLNTTGMYSLVRHPLYLANYIIFAGFVLMLQDITFFIIASLAYALYYERIMMAEERFLADVYGDAYQPWAQTTPAFFPRTLTWQKPTLPFCIKTVLRRETAGFLLICAVFFSYELLEDLLLNQESWKPWLSTDGAWIVLLAFGLLLYGAIRVVRKKTTWLQVDGR